ncbi:hypothetical protein HMPREF9574_02392 [Cutibacterium acnes HL074PA1]|nr:hypothetical protein HMPREF9574_02392 [Cutibacterium acnes HL074PA1]
MCGLVARTQTAALCCCHQWKKLTTSTIDSGDSTIGAGRGLRGYRSGAYCAPRRSLAHWLSA